MIVSFDVFSVKKRFRFLFYVLFFVFQLVIIPKWDTWTGIRDNISLWGYDYMFVIKNTFSPRKEIYLKNSRILAVPEPNSNDKQENMKNLFLRDLIGM